MDTLTFGSPILLRHLTFSEARKIPIMEMHLDEVLTGLNMNMDQVRLVEHLHHCSIVHRFLHITWVRLLRFHKGNRSSESY